MTFLTRSARRSCKLPPGAARRTSRASVHFGTTPPHKTHGLHPSFSPQGTTALDMYRYDDARPFFNGDTQGIASYRFAPHSIASLHITSHRSARRIIPSSYRRIMALSNHRIVASLHRHIVPWPHCLIITSSHYHVVARMGGGAHARWRGGGAAVARRWRGGGAAAARCNARRWREAARGGEKERETRGGAARARASRRQPPPQTPLPPPPPLCRETRGGRGRK
jgi:hypothetical protein